VIVWTGYGWIGVAIIAVSMVATPFALDHRIGDAPFRGPFADMVISSAIAAVGCWIAGRILNRGLELRFWDPPQQVYDADGAPLVQDLYGIRTVPFKASLGHTICFVRVEFVGILVGLLFSAAAFARERGLF
jgi:hypothetical protein